MRSIYLYDTTLRDGMQGQGINLSVAEKIKVIKLLDKFRVDYIEAGFFAANQQTEELFAQLNQLTLSHSQLTAFTMTRRKDSLPEENQHLRHLLASPYSIVTLVGKTWDFQVKEVLHTSCDENLSMLDDSFRYLSGKQLIFDAEHFFDAYISNPDYALECLDTVINAGAGVVTLCDTNGAFTPEKIEQITFEVKTFIDAAHHDKDVLLGIHTHNDRECAVANSLAATAAGADLIQGTVNGYGERCGNANLISLAPTLATDPRYHLNADISLSRQLAVETAQLVNLPLDPNAAYVGKHAFTHKGGMHVSAVLRNPDTFEHISPERVGNQRSFAASDLSGKALIKNFAEEANILLTDKQVNQALELLKQREANGYQYEDAEASFELLLRREFNRDKKLFNLKSYQVTDSWDGSQALSEAVIRFEVAGEAKNCLATGNGPVNALDSALRQGLEEVYPRIKDFHLTNYYVRIIDTNKGTSAVTRVVIETTDSNGNTWSTVGVADDIINASWQALVDAFEYPFN